MDESDGPEAMADAGETADADVPGSGDAPLVPSRLVAVGFTALLVQFGLLLYVLVLRPPSAQVIISFTILGLSFVAALLVGFDAYRTDRNEAVEWSPNPFLWTIPMFFPLLGVGSGIGIAYGIPLGVGIAYVVRRFQTLRRGLDHIWQWPAVGAGVLSGGGYALLVTAPLESGPLPPTFSAVLLGTSVLFGFTTPAAYYDTQYVRARLAADGDNWLFRGYHWVVAMSVPFPLRSIVALGYALRRWMLLNPGGFFWSSTDPAESDDDNS